MPLIQVLIVLVVIGFLMYAQERWIPKSPGWNTLIRWVVGIFVAIWLLNMVIPLSQILNSGPRVGRP